MIQAPLAQSAARRAALFLPLFLAACSSGADVSTFGGGTPPVGPLAIDFNLRRDLHLGGTQTSDALAVDLNGDGRADIVEANFLDGTIRSALRDSLGGFGLTQVVEGNGGAVWRLASGDFNADGLVDVAAVEVVGALGSNPALSVFLQDAPGHFGSRLSEVLQGDPIDLDVIPSALSPLAGGIGGADVIAIAENGADRVSVWRFDGVGMAEEATLESSALGLGAPLTIAAVDVAGDGRMDLVVGEVDFAGGTLDRVIVYPADGAGGFGAPLLLALTQGPVLDAIGDVDANGYEDVGVAELEGQGALVLLFDAAGNADVQQVNFDGGTSSLVFGDLDGVNGLDVAATVLLTQELVVRLSNTAIPGALSFGELRRLNAGFLPRTVAAVELNDDGLNDLLCPSNSDISLLFGDGEGGFRAASGYPVGVQPVHVRPVDLDNDDDRDLVVVDVFQRQVSFLENYDASGSFRVAAEIPFDVPASEELPGGVDVGDVDGDGYADVVIALHALNEVRVVHNPATAVEAFMTTTYEIYALGLDLYGVALGDLDEDGWLDILVSSSGDQSAHVLLNDSTQPGFFVPQAPIALSFSPAAVLIEDLDGDGFLDAAFTGNAGGPIDGSAGPVLGLLKGDGAGMLGEQGVLPVDTVGSALVCGEFNGDGLCDLVAGQPALAFEQVFVYLSTGAFEYEGTPLLVDGSPGAVDVADVDLDGNQDIVVPTGEGELRVALGDGTGAFPEIEPPGLGIWPVPLGTAFSAFSDVDGDLLPDLILVSPKTPNVWVGKNLSVELPTL
jgi:hypothetical protein